MSTEASAAAIYTLIKIIREKKNLPERLRKKFDKRVIKLTPKMAEETEQFLNHLEIEKYTKDPGTEAIVAATYTLVSILREKENLPLRLRQKFDKRVIKLTAKMVEETEQLLHHLDIEKYSEDSVRTAIKVFPEALSQKNERDRLPIQEACYSIQSLPFVPLLAEEGRHVFTRGGLLLDLPSEEKPTNILQLLSKWIPEDDPVAYDKMSATVLKRLKKRQLLQSKDIKKYDLVGLASYPSWKKRFDCLVKMDPKLLHGHQNEAPLLNIIASQGETSAILDRFEMVLRAGIQFHPERVGFLFKKTGDHNESACDLAFKIFSKDIAMDIIRKCIPEASNYQAYTRIFVQYFQT